MRYLLICLLALTACSGKKQPIANSAPANAPLKVEDLKESPRGTTIEGIKSLQPHEYNWFNMNPEIDKFEGVSSALAIKEFGLTHPKQIIVAVIDSGVDVHHEDLQGKIWENPGESGDKASNGIDDDKNGYIDDIHGWNFIGGKDGKHVDHENLEMTRITAHFEKRIKSGEVLNAKDKAYFEEVKAVYLETFNEAQGALTQVKPAKEKADKAMKLLKEKLGLEDYSAETLKAIKSEDKEVSDSIAALLTIIGQFRSVDRLIRVFSYYDDMLKYYLNKDFNARSIVGDDPNDFNDTKYGNNDVFGPDASHGTHVSGTIAAIRGNGLGVDGIAENVRIMVLRVVPNGDERDKDIALAVRYAANNGAHIINMSFGKQFSPSKDKVDEAFLYAQSKGVLIAHAAGNESSNNDEVLFFPNRNVMNAKERNLPAQVSTWIEVGASSRRVKGAKLPAEFSNYGKREVDFFSPGHLILSTVPGNKYDVYSGTSMATPAAVGVAALLWSQFPSMTALEVRGVLLSQVRQYGGLKVKKPGSEAKDLPNIFFSNLSVTGGVIDAFRAIDLAMQMSEE